MWTTEKRWSEIRAAGPDEIEHLTRMGERLDQELNAITNRNLNTKQNAHEFRSHVISNIKRQLYRLKGAFIRYVSNMEDTEDIDVEADVDIIRRDFRIVRYILGKKYDDQIEKDNVLVGQVENYLSKILDLYERVLYDSLLEASREWDGEEDFRTIVLEKAVDSSNMIYLGGEGGFDSDSLDDLDDDKRDRIETGEELEDQLSKIQMA